MSDFSEVHEQAHELRDIIAATVEAYLAFRESQGQPTNPAVVLMALEMEASVVRRLCRDSGMPKDLIKSVQSSASMCGKEVYDSLDDEKSLEEKHDVQVISALDN